MPTVEYREYWVAVSAKEKTGLWSANIWIWPVLGKLGHLVDEGQVNSFASQGEAEAAGRRWGETRIDNWIASGE